MEDDKTMEDCGCHCDMCMKGDHEHCPTGLCREKYGNDATDTE